MFVGKRSVLDLRKVQERLNIRIKYVIVGDKNLLSSPSVHTRLLVCGVLRQVEISVSIDKNLHLLPHVLQALEITLIRP
jgi:hypothetical protein